MDALRSLEKIAEQASFRINAGTQQRQTKFNWPRGVSPNLTHAKVAREKKPLPAAPESPPKAAPETHVSEVIFSGIEVTSYVELVAGIQARIGELGIRQVDFDKLAGFADGLTGKVFGPSQVKRLGPEKLFDAIRAASLRLRLEADPEQLERMRKQIAENCQPRQATQARMGNHSRPSNKMIDDVLSHLASKRGGLAQLRDAVKKARSNWARHAANALHAKTGQRFGNISPITPRALPPPRETRDTCAEQEATAA
jgi:hypothetical protein